MKKELIKSNRFYKLNVCFVGNREYIDTALEISIDIPSITQESKKTHTAKKILIYYKNKSIFFLQIIKYFASCDLKEI